MSTELATAELISPRRRPLAYELAFVVVVSLAVLVPGIWSYSLVDPWETHYGEVGRMMLQQNDWVRTEWPQDSEGFRSKPVLTFWLMATGMRAVGMAQDGGYSGEMVHDARTMIGIRLPFVACAVAGLAVMWWMLARLWSRRMAWLGLLVVGSAPMFCMIARQAIPDMPLVACTVGAMALFIMAVEDGERPILPLWRFGRRQIAIDPRHVVLGLAGAFILVQAAYYAVYFTVSPQLALRGRMPNPALWLPLLMVIGFGALSRDGWLILRLPMILLGGVIAAIVNEPMPVRRPDQTMWRAVFDNTLRPWERHAIDRYLVRGLVWLGAQSFGRLIKPPMSWADTQDVAEHVLRVQPLTTMRQLYLLGCYFLVGVSILAKGPPGLAVVGATAALYVLLLNRWRELYRGDYELKRSLVMMIVTFLPWHVAMYLKDGIRFIDEYLFTHILNRAAVGVDNSPGTFEYYTSQLGVGMWLWAALLPAAIGVVLFRIKVDTREGRVRFIVALWAITTVAFFCLVQTKFHHYILPAIPPLALLVAMFLDDLAGKRERLHPLYAALGAGIVLLICRDLMSEPEHWIEMFVFRYDRPWPSGEPYGIDPSDGFLVLGLIAAVALLVCATRFVRAGVACLCVAGLAIAVWSLQAYMPVAGQHWGMREAVRTYYEQRSIYGQKLVYFGTGELYDDWKGVKDTWTFETHVPDAFQVGQPMTIAVEIHKADDERITEREVTMIGTATGVGDHSITVTIPRAERARLDPLIAQGASGPRGRPPVRAVDADRLIAWQLYWRGENFWSGDEIWGWLPEMKTAFVKTDNVEFNKYINDRTRAPLGRRYFVVTEGGRITGIRSLLPTQRARDSFEVLNTVSNKFSLAAFSM